ncbi:MAG: hypothetical protein WC728_17270 [Elusimicrobiota bacterium]
MTRAILLACFAQAASAQVSESTAPVQTSSQAVHPPDASAFDLAVFQRTDFSLEMAIVEPFERLLQQGGTALSLVLVDNVPSHSNGEDYLYQLPESFVSEPLPGPEEPFESDVDILEAPGGYFLLMPPDERLLGRIQSMAREPGSYVSGTVPRLRRRKARLTRSAQESGGVIHSLRLEQAGAVRYPQWRSTVALAYRVSSGVEDYDAVFLYKTLGGEGRLASALERIRREGGRDLLALNRGEMFVAGPAKTTGTLAGFRFERMGVRAAAVGEGELFRLQDVLAYRAASPDGVRFLSANLVYSTAPAQTVFPAAHVFEVGGRSVAVFGLTDPDWSRMMTAEFAGTCRLADPIEAARELAPRLRAGADVVVALSNLPAEMNTRLRREVRGIDVIAGDGLPFRADTAPPSVSVEDPERGPSDEAMLVTWDWSTVLSRVEVRHRRLEEGTYALTLREEPVLLDERLPDSEGYPKFDPAAYGVSADTSPPVLPSARRLYEGRPGAAGLTRLEARDFWRLAASLAADRTGAEAVLVPVYPLEQRTTGDYKENLVREWFARGGGLSVFELGGGALRSLLQEAQRQKQPGAVIPPGGMAFEIGGVGAGDTVHGIPIDPRMVYKVAATDSLLARTEGLPALAGAAKLRESVRLEDAVLRELRQGAAEGWTPDRYRALMAGEPLKPSGLWTIDFRDISLNVSNTKVVSDPAFSDVSNARVRGFDELLIGGEARIDADYLRGPLRQFNSFEAEYSRSRLSPPGQPMIINTPQNRTAARTGATVRTSSFPLSWIAKSAGPSVALEYEGHVERLPGQRRRHIFAVLPGMELYGGDFVNTLSFAGNFRRDYTPPEPLNNYGVRLRTLFSTRVWRADLAGEVWSNYFIRTAQDTAQDLRLELDASVKLHLPLVSHLTLAPFLDYYYYVLKVRPISGYSVIVGVSLSYSRLWKPQFERF